MQPEIENQARNKAKEIFKGEHGNVKGEIWICGYIKLSTSKKTKCLECKEDCYYDSKLEIEFEKNHKKICMKCALKNHKDELSHVEKEIIESCLK